MFKRPILLLALTVTFSINAATQENDDSKTIQRRARNSMAEMIDEQAPALQPGFGSDWDRWLLYSRFFDVLSAGRQKLLLEKYGYVEHGGRDFDAERRGTTFQRESVSSAQDRLVPGTNVKVTIPDAETGRRFQSEATIAVSGQNVVVGYNDAGGNERVSYSRDGGANWRQTQLPAFPPFATNISDPVLAAGPDGRFYHAVLTQTAFGQIVIGVSRSDDGGANWSAPSNATAAVMSSNNDHDKDWIAADNIPGSPYRGNVYVAWTMFTFNPTTADTSSIRFARSTDGGRTWSAAPALAELSPEDAEADHQIQGAYIAVGPAGEVYVAWFDTRVGGIRVRKSSDGGVTFSDPVTALATPAFGREFSAFSTGIFDIAFFASIAVDTSSGPNRGNVYVASHDRGAAGNIEVVVARSSDGGATWSAPLQVKNIATSTDRFQPDVAVANNGNVGVMFYDRRNDPENNSWMDVYLAVSTDGGRSFPANTRVTTTNWPVLPTPIGFRPGYHGDYNKIVASDTNFYMAWGDDRSGLDPDVYFAALPSTGASPDFVMTSTRALVDVVAGSPATFNITTGGATGVKLSAVSSAPGLVFQFSGNTLTVNTTADTTPGTYSIQVKGVGADGLDRGTVVRLTVHSPQLSRPPVAVTPARMPAFMSQAAVDSAGNLHILNVEEIVSRYRKQITYRRIPVGKTEPEGTKVIFRAAADPNQQRVSDPRIAVNSSGRVYAVWRRVDADNSVVLFSISEDGRTFSDPVNIAQAESPLTFAFRPSMAVARDGTIYVSFVKEVLRESRPGVFSFVSQDLYVVRSIDGGATFADPVNVSALNGKSSVSTSSFSRMVLDTDDQLHVAWLSGSNVFYARSTDGAQTFSSPVTASKTARAASAAQPALAVDLAKNVYVAWTNFDRSAGVQDIFVSKSTDGSEFVLIGNLTDGSQWTGVIPDQPTLAADTAGNVTAVWREMVTDSLKGNDPERDLFYSRSSDGGARWSAPVNFTNNVGDTLLGGNFGSSTEPPAVATGPDGRVSIFYDDDSSGAMQIWMFQLP